MSERRRLIRVSVILVAFGAVSFFSMLSRPTFQAIRAVDVVHLIGTGMCLGGAIVALVVSLRRRD
jgi:hypothetical protein